MLNREEAGRTVNAPPQPAAREGLRANLGSSVCVKGELSGSEDLTVDGRVEGRINLSDHMLTIGPNAKIEADIVAKVVMVFGSIVGSVTAREKIEIRQGGSLQGDLTCSRIVIQDGAHFSGKANMGTPKSKGNGAAADKSMPAMAAAG
jgi:cytoskeletal protein CcmA (bactofilin family)